MKNATPLQVMQALCLTIEEDFLMALRFLYYVKSKPVVPDAMYDQAEKEYMARPEATCDALMNPGSDNAKDYPDHVKALAFYLSMMGWERGQEGVKAAPSRPVVPSDGKKRGKPPGYVEAPYVGEIFKEALF